MNTDPTSSPPDDHRHELTEGLRVVYEDSTMNYTLYRCIFCTFELRCWEAS